MRCVSAKARLEKLIKDTVGLPDGSTSNVALHTASSAGSPARNRDKINFHEFVEAMSRSISGRYPPSKVKWAFNKLALHKHPERHVQAAKYPAPETTHTPPQSAQNKDNHRPARSGSISGRRASLSRMFQLIQYHFIV